MLRIVSILGLATLTTFSLATFTSAQPASPAPLTAVQPTAVPVLTPLTPFQLVTLTQGGRLEAQGIPSYSALSTAYRLGEVDGPAVVAAAIAAQIMPPQAALDITYVQSVDALLNTLTAGQ